MTVFWLAQIQLAVLSFAEANDKSTLLDRKDFKEIVLHSPSLMDSGLWKAYYSKDLLFSPDARENWRFPDLQPLPAFVANPLQQQSVSWVPEQSQDRLIRFALIVTQACMSSKVRRGALVKRALQALETSTIRARAQNQQVPPYSETQSYFWVQIVHACLLSLEAGGSSAGGSNLATRVSLPAFKSLFKIVGDEWRNYYTEKTWSSVAARREFALPDLKPLPNVIDVPTEYNEKRLEQGSGLGASLDDLSRNEVIATMVAMAMSEEAKTEEGQVTT
jgi:ubiquitin carboxyl-terminal hydrolase L3